MSTVTSTLVAAGVPKSLHAGAQSVFAQYVTTASLTAASVIQMIPVPSGARLVDGWVKSPGTGYLVSVGDGGDVDRYVQSKSGSALQRFEVAAGMGYQYSVSDDAIVRWDTIDILIGSAAATGTFQMCVTYAMDT